MKTRRNAHTYSARRPRRYPNEADPGYFIGKIRNGIFAAATGMGTVTFFMLLGTL